MYLFILFLIKIYAQEIQPNLQDSKKTCFKKRLK